MSLDIFLEWKRGKRKFSERLNITHNAGRIAKHVTVDEVCGRKITLYDVLWNHDDVNWKPSELIKYLENGLKYMSDNETRLKRYETTVKTDVAVKNGNLTVVDLPREKWYKWGELENTDLYGHRYGLIPFTEGLLCLCIKHPEATIEWSR